MSPRLARAAPYGVVALGATYLFWVAAHIQYEHRPHTIGPAFWPELVLGMAIVVCLYEMLRIGLFGVRSVPEALAPVEAPADEVEEPELPAEHPALLVSGIVLTVVYVWLLQVLGFFSATVPYLAAFVVLGGYRRWAIVAAVSGIGTVLMMYFFMKVVYVSLPLGSGPFKEVTLFLMGLLGIR